MKTMTKRDIADIALVWVILGYLTDLIGYVIRLGLTIAEPGDELNKINIFEISMFIIVLFIVLWLLIVKRKNLLDFFFPNAQETGINLEEDTKFLINYSFWIRLLGIILLLQSVVWDIPKLIELIFTFYTPFGVEMSEKTSFIVKRITNYLIPIIISFCIIWKADWIGEVLGRLGKSKPEKETGHPDET